MIAQESRVVIADNTGAKELLCIRVLGRGAKKTAEIGDIIVGTVKQATPRGNTKKGQLVRAVVVRCADGRTLGTSVFDYPSGTDGVLLDPGGPISHASTRATTWRDSPYRSSGRSRKPGASTAAPPDR